jgi:hypothetical protein
VISGLSGNLTIVFIWAPPHFTALLYAGDIIRHKKTGSVTRDLVFRFYQVQMLTIAYNIPVRTYAAYQPEPEHF